MIYFVRHGQTYDNANKIIQGNGPLNEIGIEQAKEAGELLKDIKFDVCFCSPMLRTKQTLEQILVYHKDLKVIYDDRLKERMYGDIVGEYYSSIKGFEKRWDNNIQLSYDIETIDEIYDRVASFFGDIKDEWKNKNVLVVSHKGVGRVTNAYFKGKPSNNDYRDFYLPNGKFLIYEWRK